MAKSKQAKAREFSASEREKIYFRDKGQCIFCRMDYHMEKSNWLSLEILSVMHYVPRSKNGLGIAENGAIGCQYHHTMMDNGAEGRREEMLGIMREYLKGFYKEWNEKDLVYDKWRF